MDLRERANIYLLSALLLGALLPVVLDLAIGMNLLEFLFYAYLLAIPTSLLFILLSHKEKKLLEYLHNPRSIATLSVIGLLNYALLELGLSYAERYISASLATVVYRSFPLLMLLFLPLVLRERISKHQIAALSLGFLGILIAVGGNGLGLFSAGDTLIVLFVVVIALTSALAGVLIKRYVFDMQSSMLIFNIATFTFIAAAYVASGAPTSAMSWKDIAALAYVGIVYNVFVGFMYYGALRMLKTTFVTNVYFLSPFITILFAYLLLGEAINFYYLVIALLVAVGMIIQRFDKKGSTYLRHTSDNHRELWIFDITGAFSNTANMTISRELEKGGKVLAVKMNAKYMAVAWNIASRDSYAGVYTDSSEGISAELKFVRGSVDLGSGEMLLIKVGRTEEGERFFHDVYDATVELKASYDLP